MPLLEKSKLEAFIDSFARVQSTSAVLEGYQRLVDKVDCEVARLTDLHGPNLQCKPGCDACCQIERTVNLLEAYWIWRAISQRGHRLPGPMAKQCALLVDHRCAVYEARPILCRTHGLPLVVFHKGEVGVTYCPLNFRQYAVQSFDTEEVLHMAPINAELLSLDRDFCEKELQQNWNPRLRVSLADLVEIHRSQ